MSAAAKPMRVRRIPVLWVRGPSRTCIVSNEEEKKQKKGQTGKICLQHT
jgi:hypothetical protein